MEVLVFEKMGKPEYPEVKSKGENQQQAQPKWYGVDTGMWTRATLLVKGEFFHHRAKLDPLG